MNTWSITSPLSLNPTLATCFYILAIPFFLPHMLQLSRELRISWLSGERFCLIFGRLRMQICVKTGYCDGVFSGVFQFLAKARTVLPVRQQPHLFSVFRVNFSLPFSYSVLYSPSERCTNSGRHIAVAAKFCTVTPSICGSSILNLLYVTLLAHRISG